LDNFEEIETMAKVEHHEDVGRVMIHSVHGDDVRMVGDEGVMVNFVCVRSLFALLKRCSVKALDRISSPIASSVIAVSSVAVRSA
jgi:hypothetical protein